MYSKCESVPLFVLSISLLLLCRPCLCVLFCCLRGPDLWRTLSSNAILIYTTRAIRKPLTNTKSSLRGSFPVSSANVGHAVQLFNDGSKEQTNSSVTDRKVTLLLNWLLSLTTCPFIAYKKDLPPATNSPSFAGSPRSTIIY